MPLLCFSLFERLCFPALEYVWNWYHWLQHHFSYTVQKKAPPASSMLWVPAAGWSIGLNPELAVGSSTERAPSFQQLLFVHSSETWAVVPLTAAVKTLPKAVPPICKC